MSSAGNPRSTLKSGDPRFQGNSAVSVGDGPVSDGDLLVALRGSATLEMLGLTGDDLVEAHEDSHLLETLRITHEVLVALSDAGVIAIWMTLPKDEQRNFLRWIAVTGARELRRERTAIFIQALRESPLADSIAD